MNRRRLLSAAGVGVVPLSGCTSLGSSLGPNEGGGTPTEHSESSPTATESPTTTPDVEPSKTLSEAPTPKYSEPGDVGDDRPPRDEEGDTIEIGSRDTVENPDDNVAHGLIIWHLGDDTHYLEVQIVDEQEKSGDYHSVHEVRTNHHVTIQLNEPSDYVINVYDHQTGGGTTLTVSESRFDCNSSSHWLVSYPDGDFGASLVTRVADCD